MNRVGPSLFGGPLRFFTVYVRVLFAAACPALGQHRHGLNAFSLEGQALRVPACFRPTILWSRFVKYLIGGRVALSGEPPFL
jgi:hypothetical protein